MKVLALNRDIFRWLGLSLSSQPVRMDRFHSLVANICLVTTYLLVIVCSTTYIWTHWHSENLSDTIFSIMQFVAYAAILGTYITFVLEKVEVFDFFRRLEEFVQLRVWPFELIETISMKELLKNCLFLLWVGHREIGEKSSIYAIAEKRGNLLTKLPLLLFCGYLTAVLLALVAYTIVTQMILGSNEPRTWFRMFKMRYKRYSYYIYKSP